MGIFDVFRAMRPPIVRDAWNAYAYRFGENERCIVKFDVAACDPKERSASATCRRLIAFAPVGEVSPNGLPSKTAFDRAMQIEDRFVAQLEQDGVRCWLVGTQVYRGMRELVFMVDDVAAFEHAYAVLAPSFGGTELKKNDGWTFFDEKIAPGERGQNHIGNREVIAGLKKAGSDLSRPHTIEPHFLGADPALTHLAADLAKTGFRVLARDASSVTFAIDLPLDVQDEIDDMTMWLRGKAREHGVRWDGWGAAVLRRR